MFDVVDFLHLVGCLAVIEHDLIHHERAFVKILGAHDEEVKELCVLLSEIEH